MAKSVNKKQNFDKLAKACIEFGVGMTYLTVDTVNKALNKMEKEGKISKKESEKLVKDTVSQYKAQGSKYAKRMQVELDKIAKANPGVKKELASFRSKIDKLAKKQNQ